jgi:hypothetical protein
MECFYSIQGISSFRIHDIHRRSSPAIAISFSPVVESDSHQIYIFITRVIILKSRTIEFRFDTLLTWDEGRRLRWLTIFGRQIPCIDRHIKEDILRRQSSASGKIPDMDSRFLEICWLGASRISATVHFMHRPENNLQISTFD